MANAWIDHVKAYRALHGCSYANAMRGASTTWNAASHKYRDSRSESVYSLFIEFAEELCKDFGAIYHKDGDSFEKRHKTSMGLVSVMSTELHLNGSLADGSWHLFDGNNDELPWEYLSWAEKYPKDLATRMSDRFAEVLRNVHIEVTPMISGNKRVGCMFRFMFYPFLRRDNSDYMEHSIEVTTHERLSKRPEFSDQELTRVTEVAKRRVKELQSKLKSAAAYAYVCKPAEDNTPPAAPPKKRKRRKR